MNASASAPAHPASPVAACQAATHVIALDGSLLHLLVLAGQACRKVARGQGYDVASVGDRDRTGNGQRVDMRLRRGDRQFDAACAYNANRGEARLVRLEPRRG